MRKNLETENPKKIAEQQLEDISEYMAKLTLQVNNLYNDPKLNWGHVGSLGRIVTELKQMVEPGEEQ